MRWSPAATRILVVAAAVFLVVAALRWGRYAARSAVATAPGLAGDSLPTLLVAMRASDCERYAPLLARLGAASRTGRLRTVGALIGGPGSVPEGDSVARRYGVPFPVRPEAAGAAEALMLRLGYRETPLAVLLDGRGRPRMVLPPPADGEHAARGLGVAEDHIELLAARGRAPVPAGEGTP